MVETIERALAPVEPANPDLVPTFVMTVADAKKQLLQLQDFVRSVMVEGADYGVIPGTEKPTLLKPGAEKLCEIYGYAPEIEVVSRIEDWQQPFFHYEVRCRLKSKRTGRTIADGVGSCNSRERRYSDRWVWPNEVPAHLNKEQLQKREFRGKSGQALHKYLVPNEDICTLVNTILKMAKKRALVDAVLSATRSSGIFTQDMEDIVEPAPNGPAPTAPPMVVEGEVVRRESEQPRPATPSDPAARKRQALLNRWQALVKLAQGLGITVNTAVKPHGEGADTDEQILEKCNALQVVVSAAQTAKDEETEKF